MVKFFSSHLVMLIVTILAITLWVSLTLNTNEIQNSNQNIQQMRESVQQLNHQVDELESANEQASASGTRENIIRNQLLMSKPGEYIVQLPELAIATPSAIMVPKKTTSWEEWQKLILE